MIAVWVKPIMTRSSFYLLKNILISQSVYPSLLLIFVTCLTLLSLQKSYAENATKTIIVLDGSRSMWGRIERKRKYRVAAKAVEKILDHRAGEVPLGVIAFGHLNNKSCKTVEIIQDPSLSKIEESPLKLQNFKPRSFAPISKALEVAARQLDHENNAARIILLIDGRDNCRRNPCKTLEKIRKTSYDLSVRVIGFGMRKKDRASFKCFQTHKSDSFYIANTQKDLMAALFVATGSDQQFGRKPIYKRPEVNEKQITSHLKGNSRIKLMAVLSKGTPPIREGVSWKVYKAVTDSSFRGRPAARSGKTQPVFQLKPGNYIVEATFGQTKTEAVVLAAKSGLLTHIVNLKAGTLQVETKEKADGETLEGVFYSLYKLNEYSKPGQRPIARSNDAITKFQLKAGKYLVVATHGGNRLKRVATIQAGEHARLTLEMKTGILKLSTIASRGSEPLERIFYSIYKYDETLDTANLPPREEISRTAASQPTLRLPAGRYIVRAEHDLAYSSLHVLVKPGQTTSAIINLQASRLSIRSSITSPKHPLTDRVSYKIISIKKKEKEIARTTSASKTYILTPGKYRIIARYGSINIKKKVNVNLKPGNNKNITILLNAGTVSMALLNKTGKYPKINVFWTLFDSSNKEIWRTSQPTPNMALNVGKYRILAESDSAKYEQKFEVKKGKNTEIKLEAK